ncbi:MAG: hypothetical protein ACRCS3_11140 [Paracoccaceae bacterium]
MDAVPLHEPTERPFRRRVFYIPGYDPFHPRRYRELYRKEGAAQAAISGYDLALKPKKAGGPYGWHVNGRIGGQAAEVDMEVLVWSDLVRTSMTAGIPGTYLQLVRTAWAYIGSGALFRLMRLRKGPMIAALYPIVFLLGQLVMALAVGWAAGALIAGYSHWAAGLIVGGALAYGILHLFRRYDHKVFAYYLMHDYAYSAQVGGANPAELEARMAEFGTAIRAAMDGGFDEVLVVGHSSGAHLAVSIMADMLREGVPDGPALSLLTLGHVVPMVSFLPKAARLRRDLHDLSAMDRLTWVDVTAPGDGCAFALCDPVAVTGVAPAQKRWPLVISAAFTQTLSAERWRALRWKFFRLHFQYLCAFDRPGDYDYFQITAGPVALGARYAGRKPSASRIEVARSGYRSMA